MEVVKETKEFKIIKKRSGRFGVRAVTGQWINGADKVKILLAEGLITAPPPKAEPPPAEEAPAEEASADEAPAEEESTES